MKVYCPPTHNGLIKAINDIHHKTYDGGFKNRVVSARAQRKAARRYAKFEIGVEVSNYLRGDIYEKT